MEANRICSRRILRLSKTWTTSALSVATITTVLRMVLMAG